MAATLGAAKQLLEGQGWIQHAYFDSSGPSCAIGAIHRVACECKQTEELENMTGCQPEFKAAVLHLSDTLIARTDYEDGDIIEWNDCDHTTKDDVLEIFEVAREEALSWLS